jgi:predicted aldo/keto reductase-like oxidoreductase
MNYRTWPDGKTKTSLLGFGCMRLPQNKENKIDEKEAFRLLDYAYKNGVNYFDTAYMYHDGESELVLGKFLDTKPRDSYILTSKLPVMMCNSLEDAKNKFEEQMKKLNKDYLDCYLIHGLNKDTFKNSVDWGIIDYCEDLLKQGRIKRLGFSFHDDYETFEKIITYRKWDLCQIQYNYIDQNEQAGNKGYELATKLNIPLIIMEPVKGGNLQRLPDDVTKPFKAISQDSNASFALRWVAMHEGVKVVLSGMTTYEQVVENVKTFEDYKPLTEDEIKAIDEVSENIKKHVFNGCTGCRYCMPCPRGVDIPGTFKVWNNYAMFGDERHAKWQWDDIPDEAKPKNCVKCGKCEKMCPQHLSIREDLVKAQNLLNSL